MIFLAFPVPFCTHYLITLLPSIHSIFEDLKISVAKGFQTTHFTGFKKSMGLHGIHKSAHRLKEVLNPSILFVKYKTSLCYIISVFYPCCFVFYRGNGNAFQVAFRDRANQYVFFSFWAWNSKTQIQTISKVGPMIFGTSEWRFILRQQCRQQGGPVAYFVLNTHTLESRFGCFV